jgi:hypothetical protein
MAKKYFREEEDEYCFTIAGIKEQMKAEGITELTVIEASRSTGSDFFFCKEFQQVCEVGVDCGKECESYIPNNGKNGRCKFYRNIYEPTDTDITIKL